MTIRGSGSLTVRVSESRSFSVQESVGLGHSVFGNPCFGVTQCKNARVWVNQRKNPWVWVTQCSGINRSGSPSVRIRRVWVTQCSGIRGPGSLSICPPPSPEPQGDTHSANTACRKKLPLKRLLLLLLSYVTHKRCHQKSRRSNRTNCPTLSKVAE